MAVEWLDPCECDPPHRVTHPEKLVDLLTDMDDHGWRGAALVGYRQADGRVQLMSGSHRHAATAFLRIRVPVEVYPEDCVRTVWGTDDWLVIMTPKWTCEGRMSL
jgi:hypothetical protein